MPFAASCRTGGAANDHLGPAVGSGRVTSKYQAEGLFTKALLTVANHLKSPKKVSNGLFNAGLAIALIALADSPTSPKCQQLQSSSGTDRGRASVGIVSKWALEMCRRKKKREFTLELLGKAENASAATKAILLKRFGLIRNPVSICRELGIVVKTLVKALTNAEVATADSSNETSTAATDGPVLSARESSSLSLPAGFVVPATSGTMLPAGELSSLPADDSLMTRREEPLQTAGDSHEACTATDGLVLPDGKLSAVPAGDRKIVATGSKPSVSVGGTSHHKAETATPGDKGTAVDVATNLDASPHCGASGRSSLQITRDKKCKGEGGFKTEGGADRKSVAAYSKPSVLVGGTSHDKTATPGDKGVAIKVVKDWDSSLHCGASERCLLQLTRGKGANGTERGADRKSVATDFKPSASVARPPAKVNVEQPPRGNPPCVTRNVTDRRRQKILGGPTVVVGAMLQEGDLRPDHIRANHLADKSAPALEWRVGCGDKSARPPAPEWRVGCGSGVGGSSNSEMQKELADLKLEVAVDRPAVARAGKLCARAPAPHIEIQETKFNRFKSQMKKAIAGRAMADLLFIQEQQLRKDDADRYMAELKEARGLAESRRKKNCEYESTLGEMYIKLAATEDELCKSRHLVSTLREELGVRGTPAPPPATSVPLPDSERSELGDESDSDDSIENDSSESDSNEGDTDEDDSDDGEAQAAARADSGLPQHIMDTWASCSSSSASCTSDASSEFSEDSDVEGGVNLSGEEIRVMSARREVLHQAEGVGFMASLADMKKGVATKGRKIGGGGSGEVFELEVVDRDLQEELLSFTVGAGVVLKKFKKGGEDNAFREIKALASLMPLCHPNIINVFSTNIAKRTIVMERVSRDLQALLENPRLLSNVSGEQMVGLCLGAARGLAYMHESSLVHGDVKPENIVVSDDLRSVKLIDFGLAGESCRDKVEAMTIPYTAPEAMCSMNDKVVLLDESMDVWSMAIVLIQAITRRTMGPTESDVLSHHYDLLCPPETTEAFRIAEANIEALHSRQYDSNSKADKLALGEARWRLERMINIHAGMRAKMSSPDEYMLSPRVWEEQWGLAHLGEVRKVLAVMLNSDPRSRISMKTVVRALGHPELWVENFALKKAMKTFGTGVSSEPVTEAMRMNHRNATASRIVKPLSRDVLALLARVGDAGGDGGLVGPSWSELGGEDGDEWWTKVPAVTALQ